MLRYVLKRLLFVLPTLFGVVALNFFVVQLAPGGPVEHMLAEIEGDAMSSVSRLSGEGGQMMTPADPSQTYTTSPDLRRQLEKMYGFDKPLLQRFMDMVKSYACFDLGKSFYRNRSVIDLIWERLPISLSLGLWSTLLIYGVALYLGVKKAIHNRTAFDVWTSGLLIMGYAIPSFLFALFLIIFFAGGSFLSWFPLRGLTSPGWQDMDLLSKILDYLWHMTLPVTAQFVAGVASLTMLTKNAFLEEAFKQYVTTARAKGIRERRVLFNHIFRNALLVIVAGLPSTLLHIFFARSLLIEVFFSLDGLGLLGFDAAVTRDYPVLFGTLYIFTLLGILLHILGDLAYTWVDPRIDFNEQAVNA